jgi:hypothetical protein
VIEPNLGAAEKGLDQFAVRFETRRGPAPGEVAAHACRLSARTSTFAWDVALQGGAGANDITFVGTNPPGGTPSFGPAGSVFIDGGGGHVDTVGNFPVTVVNAQA